MFENLRRREGSTCLAIVVGAALMLAMAGCSSGTSNDATAENTAPSEEAPLENTASPAEAPPETEDDSTGPQRITEPPSEIDFFRITIDGEQRDGSGLVFDNGGELSLRGVFGAEMDHLQLDLTSGGFGEQSPTIFGPVLSRVIGLDASQNRYELVDDASNWLAINDRGPALTVWGDFSIQARDLNTGNQVTISGVFDIPVGSGDWDCDWGGQPPACGFIS